MGFFLSAPIVFLANTVYLPFVISIVIGVPSAILYSFEVVIIITKWKDFNSSFFQLLIARAILVWKRCLLLTMLLIFITPLILTVQMFSQDFYARLQADNKTVTIDEHNITEGDIQPMAFSAYSCVIFMFICLIINIATLFVYKTKVQPQTNKITSNGLQQTIEKRLTLYAFWTFVGQLLISISTTLIYVAIMISLSGVSLLSVDECQNFFMAVFNQNFLVSDISTIVLPSWLLIWANGETRKHIFIKINSVKIYLKMEI
uniref:Serpentine receptor class gamma n=1 Tax=Meloidogyne enterolobii TaxID=390850 RepID=A0A6V7VSQ3_MELEN|nr:unnamed protein product [Meloidogyne enterolobii]